MWVLDKAIVIEHWTSLSFCSVVLYDLIYKQRYSSHFYPQNTKSTLDVQIELYPYGKKKNEVGNGKSRKLSEALY